MKNVYRSHELEQSAISRSQDANSAVGSAKSTEITRQANDRLIALQEESIKNQRAYANTTLALNVVNQVLSVGEDLYKTIYSASSSNAENYSNTQLQEGQRLMEASIADGTTYYGINETTGEMELVISDKVQDWYKSAREGIENGNYLPSVKSSALDSFDLSYEALKTSANSSAISKAYSDINNNYQANMSLAKQADIQSYVNAGGNTELWNETSTIEGIRLIDGRTDWSSTAKEAQTTEYLLEIQKEGDAQIVANIARTQGRQAAYDYIYGATGEDGAVSGGLSYYTLDEKNGLYSKANTALTYATASAQEAAEGYMTDALTNGTATPEQVISAVKTEYADTAQAVRDAAVDAAREKQTEFVTKVCSNQLASDTASGIDAMMETYEQMASGAWDDKFYGIEDTKASVMSKYESAIKTKQSELATKAGNAATAVTKIDTANGKIYDAYEKESKANLEAYESGAYDGKTYIETELAAAQKFNAQFEEGGNIGADTWTAKTTSAAVSAVTTAIGDYIPARYQDEANDALDYLETALGLNITSTKMTTEQASQLYDAKTTLTGQFADYVRDHGADMTDGQFAGWAKQKVDDFVWLTSQGSYDKLLDGEFISENDTDMSTRVKNFNSVVSLSYGSEEEGIESPGSYFVKWESSFGYNAVTGKYEYSTKKEGNYTFANDNVEATWNSMATLAKSEIKWLTGDDDGKMLVYCDTDEDGHPIMSPIVVSDGEAYRFKDGTIQYGNISNGTVTWVETGLKVTTDADTMSAQVRKSNMPIVKQITNIPEGVDITKQDAIPHSTNVMTDADASGTTATTKTDSDESTKPVSGATYVKEHPKASPADVKAYLESIDNEEDFETAFNELLSAAESEHFLDEKTDGQGATYINYYADEIRKNRGWGGDTAEPVEADTSGATVEQNEDIVQTFATYLKGNKEQSDTGTGTANKKAKEDYEALDRVKQHFAAVSDNFNRTSAPHVGNDYKF